MDSTKQLKVVRTEKEMAQSRRSFLRLGALGAAAVVAAGVLPTGQAHAQTSARTAATVRSGGTIGEATGGKTTRSARKMRSMGEVGTKAEGGAKTRSARSMQKQRTMKSEKSASNNRSMSTRKMGERSAQRSMKATKQMKS